MLWRIHLRRNTAKSKSGLSLWRTLQTNSKNVFFVLMFVATQLARQLRHFHRIKIGEIKKWSILILFWPWPWPDLRGRPGPLGGELQTACTCDFMGVIFQFDLTSWLVKFHLLPKHKWFFLGLLLSDFFGSLIHEKNPKTLNSIYCTRMQLWTCRGHIRNRQNVPRSFITWGRFALRRSQDCF